MVFLGFAVACASDDDPNGDESSSAADTTSGAQGSETTGDGSSSTTGTADTIGGTTSTASSSAGPTTDDVGSETAGEADEDPGTEDGESASDTGVGTGGTDSWCPETAWFCEDFETLPHGSFAGDERWSIAISNADRDNRDLEIASENPHAGGSALRATTAAGANNNWQNYLVHTFDAPQSTFFGRVFIYVERFAVKLEEPSRPGMHWYMLEHRAFGVHNGIENTNPGHLVRLLNGHYGFGVPSETSMALNYVIPGTGEEGTSAGSHPIFEDRWVCFEWLYDAAANRIVLWQDGDMLVDSEGIGAYAIPPAENVAIGAATTQGTYEPGFDVWFDDLALGSERIGCGE